MIHKLHIVEICSLRQDAANVWGDSTEPPGLHQFAPLNGQRCTYQVAKLHLCVRVQYCTFKGAASVTRVCTFKGAILRHLWSKVEPYRVQSCTFGVQLCTVKGAKWCHTGGSTLGTTLHPQERVQNFAPSRKGANLRVHLKWYKSPQKSSFSYQNCQLVTFLITKINSSRHSLWELGSVSPCTGYIASQHLRPRIRAQSFGQARAQSIVEGRNIHWATRVYT